MIAKLEFALLSRPMRTALIPLLPALVIAGCSSAATDESVSLTSEVTTQITGVTFQTQLTGNFVGAQNDGGGAVIATATVPQGWETFTLIDQNGGTLESGDAVFIKTGGGEYFQAANGGGTTLNAASLNQKGWETFRITKASGVGTIQSGDVIGLQTTTTNSWVSAANGGGGAVFAYGGTLGSWEKLVVGIPASTGGGGGGADAGVADSGVTTDSGTSTGFVHPGVLVTQGMLDFVKGKIAAGAQPWKKAFDTASNDGLGSVNYTPHARADVDCGSGSNPDNGCTDEKNDAAAAYTQALLWAYTADTRHAAAAIRIMNAWSSTITTHTNANAPLQAAWTAEVWPRAAEIIRWTNAGWSPTDVARFETMLKTVYLPLTVNGTKVNGNWDTSMIEATMNIAVFLSDKPTFDKAVAQWRKRTPAYIYLASDGALPVQPPNDSRSESSLRGYWYNPVAFVEGMMQETCRDLPNSGTQGFGHAQYGLAGIVNAAETARIQHVDLFAAEQKRLVAAMEFHAKYMNGASTSALCNTQINAVSPDPMWEIALNEFANVLPGLSVTQTTTLVLNHRPTGATHHMVWETLSHGSIGTAGL